MPSLPLDLERLIFEMAASQDTDHDNRIRIILVAKRVYEWIRPILYGVAITKLSEGKMTIRNWRKAQITDVAPFARHLLVGCSPARSSVRFCSASNVVELLSAFPNVENLAIWLRAAIVPQVLKEISNLPLRMFSVGPSSMTLDEMLRDCPALRNITHLEIVSVEGSTWNDFKVLAEFPNLTHLCFEESDEVGSGVILNLLKHCPSLQAMICLSIEEYTTESDDPRFLVLQDRMGLNDFVEEWERSANGHIGLWELADIIIEARKDKIFKDNSSFIFSRRTWMDDLNEDGMRWYLQSVAERM